MTEKLWLVWNDARIHLPFGAANLLPQLVANDFSARALATPEQPQWRDDKMQLMPFLEPLQHLPQKVCAQLLVATRDYTKFLAEPARIELPSIPASSREQDRAILVAADAWLAERGLSPASTFIFHRCFGVTDTTVLQRLFLLVDPWQLPADFAGEWQSVESLRADAEWAALFGHLQRLGLI